MKQLFTLFIALFVFTQTTFAQDHSNRAFLGIHSEEISKTKAKLLNFDNPHGAYITRVIPNTAAEKAGLKAFDYIVGIGKYKLSANNDLDDVLEEFNSGEETTVKLIRNNKVQNLALTLGNRSDSNYTRRKDSENPHLGIGIHHDNSNEELGVRIHVSGSKTTALAMGLENGDLITAINGYKMIDWDDISTAINDMEVGEQIEVAYTRAGVSNTVKAPIQSLADSRNYSIRKSTAQEYAFLGIKSNDVSKTKASKLGFDNPYGKYVTSVVGNSAAEKAGILPFDYIYGIDEYRTGENQSLGAILRKYSPGDNAEIQLVRKTQKKAVPVTFGTRSDARHSDRDKCEEAFFGIQSKHNNSKVDGVRVSIVSNSTASGLNMQNDDIITQINGYKMLDWHDISAAINSLNVGDNIKVAFVRNGNEMTANGPIKSYCETKRSEREERTEMRIERRDESNRNEIISLSTPKIDLSKVEVEMEDMTQEEADDMKENYGVDMPVVSNLTITQLKLFPNPNMGMFRLEFDLPNRGTTLIRIFNSAGRSIYEYDLGNFSGRFEDNVDLSQNGTGFYFLEIRQDEKYLTKKIVIQNS